jgi:ubiquinone/menaquinone biosynthesis C-methylase UbiE
MKKNMGLLLYWGPEAPKGFESVTRSAEALPYPFADDSVHICLMPHVLEHVKPWIIYKVFNELHRILKPNAQLAVSMPYAGSAAFWGDSSHCTGFNERSFLYLSPEHPAFVAKKVKPWAIEKGNPVYQMNGNIECVLRPIK